MSFVDSLGGYAGGLGDLLGKGLSWATDVLDEAASIKGSLDQLQAEGPSYIIGGGVGGSHDNLGSTGAGPGTMGQSLSTTQAGSALGSNTVLLLFVAGLAVVVYLAKR